MTTQVTEWEPGDPVYAHPSDRPRDEGTYVRELMQVIDEDEAYVQTFLLGANRHTIGLACCHDCLVAWSPDEGRTCWVCEGEAA